MATTYQSGSIKNGNYTLTLPSKTGTVALTSDISSGSECTTYFGNRSERTLTRIVVQESITSNRTMYGDICFVTSSYTMASGTYSGIDTWVSGGNLQNEIIQNISGRSNPNRMAFLIRVD